MSDEWWTTLDLPNDTCGVEVYGRNCTSIMPATTVRIASSIPGQLLFNVYTDLPMSVAAAIHGIENTKVFNCLYYSIVHAI